MSKNEDQVQHEIDEFGNHKYYLNGQLHRENGPALENINGDQFYYQYGKLHREDGPAYICVCMEPNIIKWYWEGTRIKCTSQQEFEQLIKLKAFW